MSNQQKTLKNLIKAFGGESQTNRKYIAYSKKAEADGKRNEIGRASCRERV